MKIRCVAIDDEQFALSAIEKYCAKVPFIDLVAKFFDPFEAINYIKQNKPDLLFLDIQMPGLSGIQIARKINYHPLVIFTTAHSRFAVEGFELNALDYLLKPFDLERFYKAVEKAKERIESQRVYKATPKEDDFIIVKIEYKNVKIYVPDILYIEAMDNYTKIFTYQKMYLTLQKLSNFLLLLPEKEFIRVHKSFIISLSKISYFTREEVVIESKKIPVGRSYAEKFLTRIRG